MILNVLFKVGESFGVFTVVFDGAGRSTLNFLDFTVNVIFALSEPFTKVVSFFNSDEWDFALFGKSSDEFLVFWIIAIFGKDAEIGILFVESFTNLVKSFNET